jgi:hypothetical protein
MDIPKWVLDPFSNTETTDSAKLEEELIEVTTNEELKLKFKEGYQVFWLQKQISLLYSGLWAVVQTFLIPLLSSYLVERGFSVVKNLLTKKRQRLKITNRGDLKMLLTKIEPNINELLENTNHIHLIKIFFFICTYTLYIFINNKFNFSLHTFVKIFF